MKLVLTALCLGFLCSCSYLFAEQEEAKRQKCISTPGYDYFAASNGCVTTSVCTKIPLGPQNVTDVVSEGNQRLGAQL